MINSLILVIVSIFVPFFIILGTKIYKVNNINKVYKFFKNITIYTSLIPLIFGLCTNRVYMNPLDTYYIIPATYYLESGLIIGLASLFILNLEEVNYKNELINFRIEVLYQKQGQWP